LSGFFLIRNVYPILASAEAKALRLLVIFLVALHAAVALSFQLLFFSYYAIKLDIGPDPGEVLNPGSGSEGGDSSSSGGDAGGNSTAEAVANVIRAVLFR